MQKKGGLVGSVLQNSQPLWVLCQRQYAALAFAAGAPRCRLLVKK